MMTPRARAATPRALSLMLCLTPCLALLTGCGGPDRPERVPVSGRVLIDGKPLEHGFVQVLPENARPATGEIGKDGRFTLTTFEPKDGVVPGKHPAVVIATESLDGNSQKWHAPKSYADAATSGLEVEIPEATDSLQIDLTWNGGQPFIERFGTE